ncbi:phosphate propanoyltransferase [Alkalicoccus chagannorensis]|uniref:phosphate propanoyltransferase n=1 Tax=Alkalicoccus chagannorensis TaxID=427072 RepID=UPI0039EFA110
MDRHLIESYVRQSLREDQDTIPVSVSNRHIHLSAVHVERLFGRGASLTEMKPLSQPGQFAAEETVTLKGPRGSIDRVRILGPVRGSTQVEISRTDARKLGVDAPLRLSGNTEGTPGLRLQGPKGMVELSEGVIVAARHIHMHPNDAARFQVNHGDSVQIALQTERPVVLDDTVIRVSEDFRLDMHIDTDEANAGWVKAGTTGLLRKGGG